MQFFHFIASTLLLVAAFGGISSAKKAFPIEINHRPDPKEFHMHIREVHECIACHDDDTPRKDLISCLGLLSEANKKLAKSCCVKTYDEQFCSKAYGGEIDFSIICFDPSKAVQVNRCFWKTTNTQADDVQEYKMCRRKIMERFCVTKSQN